MAATRADCLAVSIGNVHGVYRDPPDLDWQRLAEIRAQRSPNRCPCTARPGIPADMLAARHRRRHREGERQHRAPPGVPGSDGRDDRRRAAERPRGEVPRSADGGVAARGRREARRARRPTRALTRTSEHESVTSWPFWCLARIWPPRPATGRAAVGPRLDCARKREHPRGSARRSTERWRLQGGNERSRRSSRCPRCWARADPPGTARPAALTMQATTLHGLAGEGSVMATATEQGDLLGPFRRVHARELADEAGRRGDALDAPVVDEACATGSGSCRPRRWRSPPRSPRWRRRRSTPAQARARHDAFERSAAARRAGRREAPPADHARDPVGDRRLRRHRRPRVQRAGGREVRLRADLGRARRRARDHHLLGDVRPDRRRLRAAGVRPRARARRVRRRPRDADRRAGRQPDDLRGRGRRRRDRAAAADRLAVPRADRRRRRGVRR